MIEVEPLTWSYEDDRHWYLASPAWETSTAEARTRPEACAAVMPGGDFVVRRSASV